MAQPPSDTRWARAVQAFEGQQRVRRFGSKAQPFDLETLHTPASQLAGEANWDTKLDATVERACKDNAGLEAMAELLRA